MFNVTKEVKDRSGAVLATIQIEQADSLEDATLIAGDEKAAVAVFNREWVVHSMNKYRPGRKASGAAVMVKGFKALSPEVQAALKGKSVEEITALLEKLPGMGA